MATMMMFGIFKFGYDIALKLLQDQGLTKY